MYCNNCGMQIPDDSKVCPYCGKTIVTKESVEQAADRVFNAAEKEIGNAVDDIKRTFDGTCDYSAKEVLNDNRGLLTYMLFCFITCGIYHYYFIYKLAHDINVACDGDGEDTAGLAKYILLCLVTCGFYSLYWQYALANRLASNASRYDLQFQENGTTVLLWNVFGSLFCFVGPFIAYNIIIKNSNKICAKYNRGN